jgi:hypothetical protein
MTSKIKVDNINKVSDDSNIINKCGTTITLGASGDSIALASGASQTGFGRTGTVDWVTTPKTGDFTAVNGEGYFVNTTSGAVTMTMPSGSAGAIVSIQDYNKTFDSYKLTVSPASGERINGGSADGDLEISTEGQGLTFVYVDATVGWKTVHENEFTQGGSSFMVATGGTITTSGNDKIHTFTGPGTFTVCTTAVCAANNLVSYMVIAGGGGGGNWGGGGGGAGGYRETKSPATPYTASPLDGYSTPGNRITVSATGYPIAVGAGGAGPPSYPTRGCGTNGVNSSFSTITSQGGGKGGNETNPSQPTTAGNTGGSGGGGRGGCGGVGNTPPVTPAQGKNGGGGHSNPPICGYFGGGGGGATAVGASDPGGNDAGPGGAGATSCISGSPVARAGGGGGGNVETGCSTGGAGGGGAGGGGDSGGAGTAGTVNTGGGGGAAGASTSGGASAGAAGAGGSGIVIIRYKFQ